MQWLRCPWPRWLHVELTTVNSSTRHLRHVHWHWALPASTRKRASLHRVVLNCKDKQGSVSQHRPCTWMWAPDSAGPRIKST